MTQATGTTLHLLTPEDWRQLPLVDDDALRRAVHAVVERQFRGTDSQPLLRREAEQALLDRGRSARAHGGTDLYLCYATVGGLPLAMSLLVSLLPMPDDDVSLHGVARHLEREGARTDVVELASGRAVRRQAVEVVDELTALGAPAGTESLLVDYALPGPPGTLLLLSFASPLVAVADALAELFEAVASSVEWTP